MAKGGQRPGAGRKPSDLLEKMVLGALVEARILEAQDDRVLAAVNSTPLVRRLNEMRADVEARHGRSGTAGNLVEQGAATVRSDKRLRAAPQLVRRAYDKTVLAALALKTGKSVRYLRACQEAYRKFERWSVSDEQAKEVEAYPALYVMTLDYLAQPSVSPQEWLDRVRANPAVATELAEIANSCRADSAELLWKAYVEPIREDLTANDESAAARLSRIKSAAAL